MRKSLTPGLYVVATPIGNLGDMTLRALDVLASADLIACEDTRVSGKLLKHFDIRTQAVSYHDHNAAKRRPELLAHLAGGKSLALISDAGTPLVSDPGYKLVHEAITANIPVFPVPGASSVLAALMASGLPTDSFTFIGFLPTSPVAAARALGTYADIPGSLILFESPKRLPTTLSLLKGALGEREAAVCRELTKLYEETRRGTLSELIDSYQQSPEVKGEVVIVLAPRAAKAEVDDATLDRALREKMAQYSIKQSVSEVVETLQLSKKRVYARALILKDEGEPC